MIFTVSTVIILAWHIKFKSSLFYIFQKQLNVLFLSCYILSSCTESLQVSSCLANCPFFFKATLSVNMNISIVSLPYVQFLDMSVQVHCSCYHNLSAECKRSH